ncbi:MAG: efflux RND transporter permease subunit [Verrucomicrobia bacterium]|nr:efflux RND transporter permease subunit [Verrucomicrobiota bacterium]
MFLSRASIDRPVLATMMNLALILFGVISLSRLPVRELPDIDPPVVTVTTIYPGANAQVVETEVTERLEEAINSVEGIKTLTSQSREQVSTITIEFNLARGIEPAAQDVRDRVARMRGALPLDVREPIVAKQDSDSHGILWSSLSSDRYSSAELTLLAERQIKPRFQTVPGVSSIIIGGEKRYAMRLWLDASKMAAKQTAVLDVQRALRQQNIELPSGRVENLDREMSILTRGEMKSAEEFNNLVVRSSGDALVRLKDIGRAEDGAEDYRTIARANGKPCVFLGVVKQSKANTVSVAGGIKREIADIIPLLPPGVELTVGYDESTYVERAITEVWETLAIAFGLVILIIFVFLRTFRATLIPSVAIPISIIGTFAVLHAFGYSINILTMLALVLAIGVVVDDAIVVLEAIHRYVEQGMPPREAALKAMDEISFAVIAITVALVAVFLPLAFQTGQTGRLFVEFAVAICGAVILSAFVALTLAPAMAAKLLKPMNGRLTGVVERMMDAIAASYGRTLVVALRWRFGVVLLAVGSFALMVLAYRGLEKDFLPDEDKGRLFCMMFTPNGSTSEFTDRQLRKMEKIVGGLSEVRTYASMVAPGFNGPGEANMGLIFVTLSDDPKRKNVVDLVEGPGGLQGRFMQEVEGAIAIPSIPKAIGGGFSAPFELIVQHSELEVLGKAAEAVANKLRTMSNLTSVRVSYEVNKPELRVEIDRNRAAALGVTVEDVSRTLQILFGGLDVSRLKMGGKEYNVIAQLERQARLTPQDMDSVFVRSSKGELIQLSSVVRTSQGAAPNSINHYGRLRSASITASPQGAPLGTIVAMAEPLIREELPPGALYRWGSEVRDLKEAASDVWWILILASVIIYMTLASQFESLVHPFTVMLAIPLAGVGAFGLLWLLAWMGSTGIIPPIPAMTFNLFSQVGLVLLIGLVTKNSILLVEYANQRMAAGADAMDAMIEAGRVRLRPILMTAFSTVAGILPIAIGFGAGAESRRPMGVAVVGGMLTSTFLTLFVIPAVYVLFSRFSRRKGHRA